MNKVFKVIWSEARNAYVVVSEIAKNHGSKSCSTKKLLTMLIATGVMTCASMAPAMADNPASDDANKGWNLFVNDDMTTGAVKVQPDGYVNLRSDEGNIIVSAKKENFGPVVKVELSKNLNVDSIHAGDFFMNNAMGIGFGGDAYITQSGLNANGKVITNVAAGTADTDAVNVSHDGTKVQVELNKDIDVNYVQTNSLNAKYNLSVGTANENGIMPFFVNSNGAFYGANNNFSVDKDGKVTATAGEIGNVVLQNGVFTGHSALRDGELFVGDASGNYSQITTKGAKLGKVTVAADGKISGVAAGAVTADSTDAVNGSQLYATNQEVANNTNRINKLGSRVNKVGAGAAALAALHPMDFDPDDKLTFSAGYGNYAGENAAAIGAYYRPDEKVMFSVAGTVGNGENMVNAGVSFALDRTNHVSNSRTALAREVIDLRGQLAVMGAKMAKMEKAFGMLDETKTKLFPDVPANHWAYEYIAKLAGNGYIEGYPDGNFGGDRLMTRYEFAAMLYRAIENGAALEEKIIKEFEPELGRIRVDRISGEDGDRDKIERVRVNDTKGERDHYGNKLAK